MLMFIVSFIQNKCKALNMWNGFVNVCNIARLDFLFILWCYSKLCVRWLKCPE